MAFSLKAKASVENPEFGVGHVDRLRGRFHFFPQTCGMGVVEQRVFSQT